MCPYFISLQKVNNTFFSIITYDPKFDPKYYLMFDTYFKHYVPRQIR